MSRGTLDTGPLDFLSPTRVSLSAPLLPRSFGLDVFDFCRSSTPDVRRCPVWALPCSLAATWGISFDYFSSGYLDVSVRRVCLPFGYWNLTSSGLPHSGTRGSGLTCSSPRLFAAYRAFRRLGTPRHPPYALGSLTFFLPLRYHIAMMSMLVIFMTLNPKMSVKPFCLHYLHSETR